MTIGTCYVIGSGPAGAAASLALLEAGRSVVMLDAGIALEPERLTWVDGASHQSPDFVREVMPGFCGESNATRRGVPDKRVFGSEFPYESPECVNPVTCDGFEQRASFAAGGLSNVWGAAMMPYRQADLSEWPITAADLAAHYRRVVEMTGMAAVPDDLAMGWPLHGASNPPPIISTQAEAMRDRLDRNSSYLQGLGVSYGRSRLAVTADGSATGCRYCGMCLRGCVYDSIWRSTRLVDEMRSHERFTYVPNVIVDYIAEAGHQVTIASRHRATGERRIDKASRAFVGAGLLNTTQLCLRSFDLFNTPVAGVDSQYFLVPLLSNYSLEASLRGHQHTLSQLFMEIDNRRIAQHGVHLQVYTYNELISQGVRNSLKFLGPLAKTLADRLDRRLLVIQGYLDSRESSRLTAVLKNAPQGDSLHVSAVRQMATRVVIRRVTALLARIGLRVGFCPIFPMVHVASPGRGYHSGGTFPMANAPSGLQSDIIGRPAGRRRIHLVDSTVFPTVAATTITMTVMANAHRIATASASI